MVSKIVCSTSSMFSTIFIDISLIFVQLGVENFGQTVRDHFYYLRKSSLKKVGGGKVSSLSFSFILTYVTDLSFLVSKVLTYFLTLCGSDFTDI